METSFKKAVQFCTCYDLNCPNHPGNHDKGCTKCIEKNLKLGEIPTCFFKMSDPEYRGPDYYFKDFAKLVLGSGEILKEITTRHSVRKYKAKDLTDAQIENLLEAARLAPSGSNKQPWEFIVIRSQAMKEKVCQADHGQKWMMSAPVFIVIVGDEKYRGDGDMDRVIRDSAIAAENVLLQAEYMGLGCCWTGWYEQDEMRAILGLEDSAYVAGVITVGYSNEVPAKRPRRKLEYRVL